MTREFHWLLLGMTETCSGFLSCAGSQISVPPSRFLECGHLFKHNSIPTLLAANRPCLLVAALNAVCVAALEEKKIATLMRAGMVLPSLLLGGCCLGVVLPHIKKKKLTTAFNLKTKPHGSRCSLALMGDFMTDVQLLWLQL